MLYMSFYILWISILCLVMNNSIRRTHAYLMDTLCALTIVFPSVACVFSFCMNTVDVLGTGVPRLACLRPTAWLHRWSGTAHLQHQPHKTLAKGQASRGGRCHDLHKE